MQARAEQKGQGVFGADMRRRVSAPARRNARLDKKQRKRCYRGRWFESIQTDHRRASPGPMIGGSEYHAVLQTPRISFRRKPEREGKGQGESGANRERANRAIGFMFIENRIKERNE